MQVVDDLVEIVIAFVSTPVITLIALIAAYFSDSMPEHLLNEVDYHVVQRTRRLLRQGPILDEESELERIAREGRVKAYRAFVLALSDQQLVTGLATLIAGFYRHCTLTTYSFTIVGACAWLSATTHLSSVLFLEDHYRKFPRIRDLRVIFMTCSIVLLLVTMTIQLSTAWYEGRDRLFQCSLQHFTLKGLFSSTLGALNELLAIYFIISAFVSSLIKLYTKDDDDTDCGDWWTRKVAKRYEVNLDEIGNYQGRFEKAVKKVMTSKMSPFRKRLELEWCTIWFLFFKSQESALSNVMEILFGNVYGIANLMESRSYGSFWSLSGNANEMGFGQMVPLLLFLLPVIAAGQSYFGRTFLNLPENCANLSFRNSI